MNGDNPPGTSRRVGCYQRLAMYIVISKPRRISVAAGFSHFIRLLLSVDTAQRGKCTRSMSACTLCSVRVCSVCSIDNIWIHTS